MPVSTSLPVLVLDFPPAEAPSTSLLPPPHSHSTVHAVPPTAHSTLSTLPSSSFSALLASPPTPSALPPLPLLLRLLSPSAPLILHLPSPLSPDFHSALILAGFINLTTSPTSPSPTSPTLTSLTAAKPAWAEGAKAKLNFARKAGGGVVVVAPEPAPAAIARADAGAVWTLGGRDMMEDDVGLEDEDDLLAREVEAVPVKKPAAECGPAAVGGAKKKACKNCTCGLAQEEAAGAAAALKPSAAKSACGSCGLGDAFRCASCPFLGQPAFANNKVGGGAVKLQL